MEPQIKLHFFGRKVIFSIPDVPERFKESISWFPANFKKISESQIFDLDHVTRPHIELKLAVFETCSNYLDMGWVYLNSVLTPEVTLKGFLTIGRLEVGSM